MLRLLSRLLGRRSRAGAGDAAGGDGRWELDFSAPGATVFSASADERYGATLSGNGLELELRRGDLFAWTDIAVPPASDARIEATLRLGPGGPRRSAGLLFRKGGDSSFLYALVSSEGQARLDAVVNGEPRALVPWVACPWVAEALERGADGAVLGVIVRGKGILVMVNGRFALEAEDDALESGGMAFAAQSYGAPANLGLESLSVDARPLEVEADYLRFGRVLPVDPGQRRRLAEGLFAIGSYVPALVQLKKIRDRGQAEARDGFLEAECYLRLGLLSEAQAALDACLAVAPDLEEAVEERYNLLYLRGDYLGLLSALEADERRLADSPRLQNLLGHARFGLGRYEEAAAAYAAAADGDPSMPLYRKNLAEALDRQGDAAAASAAYLAAARSFYDEEAWDDAADCSAALRARGYDKAALDAMDALIAYARGRRDEAEALLARLWKRGRLDAPAAYVYGLILTEGGRRDEALKAYRKAAELEPGRPIYRYRLAEALFSSLSPGYEDAVAAALEAAPEDGWTVNLAGQAELAAGRAEAAAALFARAAASLPGEAAPAVNLSEALSALGRHAEAVEALGAWPASSAQAANRRGNALASSGDLAGALEAYGAAVGLAEADDPALADYRVNRAAALLELGRPGEAGTELAAALELREDTRALGLMGDIAGMLGDLARAELAYRAALELDPSDARLRRRLAEHYLGRRRFAQAEAEIAALSEIDRPAAEAVREALRLATTERIACAACGRAWDLPRELPSVKRTSLKGEPPDEAPAGSCPSCGAVYCVACRKGALEGGRFTCPRCGDRLTLNDDRVRWLVLRGLGTTGTQAERPDDEARRPSSLPF